MMRRFPHTHILVLLALLHAPGVLCAHAEDVSPTQNLSEYRKHLESLEAIVVRCRSQRTVSACDPSQVGADDRLAWASEQREVRYGWLRDLLVRAGGKEEPLKTGVAPLATIKTTTPTVDTLLAQAQQRLEHDWSEAGELGRGEMSYSKEHRSLSAILARKEYQGAGEMSARERAQEWLENWLVNIFNRLVSFGYRSPWIAFALRALLLGTLGTALIWALIRIEWRSRKQLSSGAPQPANAPSAREWQLWLDDARRMAAQARWREAIHFLYWASISRLESKRLWPADRARTPREYLRLLPEADERKTSLTALTRSFERTWYGGRDAASSDFQAALQQAAELGVE